MKYLIRDGKVEYSGSRLEIINYIVTEYEDDYYVQEYADQLAKDFNKLRFVLTGLGLYISETLPKRRKKK